MNFFVEWFKHLFIPHCVDCVPICRSCETLKEQIAILHKQNQQLLDRLCLIPEPVIETDNKIEHKPIAAHTPWRVRKMQLERASLIKKEQLAQNELVKDLTIKAPKPIEELEEELGLNDAAEA